MRRVLIVTHVFPPQVAGGAPRMGQFARMLPDFGWDVTVLTCQHRQMIDPGALERVQSRARIVEAWSPTARVVKRGQPVPTRGVRGVARRALRMAERSLLFPDREIFWVPGAVDVGSKALASTPHDAILASYPPASALLAGYALSRRHRLPLIVDFRDLWATLPMAKYPTPLHRAAALGLERTFVRHASRVITVAPKMGQHVAATHGIPEDRAVTITNGFDPDHAARVRDDRGESPRPFRLVYTGAVHSNYDLGTFWRVIRELADEGAITPESLRLEFVGNLALSDVRAYGIEQFVEIRPFVAHSEVFDVLARADALLLVETPGYYARFSYAAKVFDYLLTGKPVIGIIERDGNSARLLEAAGVAYLAEPGDAITLRQRIETVLSLKETPARVVDPDRPPFSSFNRHHLVARLASTLDDAVS
jgi:glycosyltransferase involved in cell wall biosynthesis